MRTYYAVEYYADGRNPLDTGRKAQNLAKVYVFDTKSERDAMCAFNRKIRSAGAKVAKIEMNLGASIVDFTAKMRA